MWGEPMAPEERTSLLALDGEGLAAALHLYAHRFLSIEDDAAGDAVGADGQVQAVAGRVEVAEGGAPADAVGVVEGHRADAGGFGVVVVGDIGEALVAAGGVEGGLVGQELLALEAAGDDGAVGVVEVIAGEVGVGLDAAQEREQLDEAPFVVAHLGPGVVVLGDAAEEDLAVDGAGAAGDLAAGDHHGGCGFGGFAPELPVVVAGHDVGGGGVAELDLVGQLLELGVVRAGLQQEDGDGGVFAEAGGHDGAGGPGAHHDVVVFHGRSPCCIARICGDDTAGAGGRQPAGVAAAGSPNCYPKRGEGSRRRDRDSSLSLRMTGTGGTTGTGRLR